MSRNVSEKVRVHGRLTLAACLAVQVLLALAIDQALARLWSGTTALFNLAFPLTLCALVAYFATIAVGYRRGSKLSIWRNWRWISIFWILAFLTICSGGGTLEDTSLAMCPVGDEQWVPC